MTSIVTSLRCSTPSDNCDTLGLSVICRSLKVHYDSEAPSGIIQVLAHGDLATTSS